MKSRNKSFWSDESSKSNQTPQASFDPNGEDDDAKEKRRLELERRKNDKRRKENILEEEGDPDLLLQKSSKPKRQKKKKPRPELWYDESIEDESDEVFEGDRDKRERRKNNDDWYNE